MALFDPTYREHKTSLGGNMAFNCRAFVGIYSGSAWGASRRNAKKLALKRLIRKLKDVHQAAVSQAMNAGAAIRHVSKKYRKV